MAIRAVMFDFGGVISSSPFDAFAQSRGGAGPTGGFIRTVNATNPDDNAWARLERSEVDLDTFAVLWSDEARALGHDVDGRAVLERLAGQIRPEMVAAIRTCRATYKTACLTNNFGSADREVSAEVAAMYELFDAVLESRTLGVRKPDPRFYELACAALDVKPDECVFLDDLGVNLKPARVLGMRTIKVTTPMSPYVSWPRCCSWPLTESWPGRPAIPALVARTSATRRAPLRPLRAAWRPARRPKNEPSPRLMPLA